MRWTDMKLLAPAAGVACLMLGTANAGAAIVGTAVTDYAFNGSRQSSIDDVLGVDVSLADMLDSSTSNNLKYLAAGNPGQSIGRWTSRSAGSVGTVGQAITGDDGLFLTLTPDGSSPVTFTGISLDLVFQNLPDESHTTTWALYGSLDGFATAPSDSNKLGEWTLTDLGTPPVIVDDVPVLVTNDHWISSQEVLLPGTFANLSTPVSFRLYFSSTLVTSGNMMGVDNLKVYATPVPEPAAIGLIGCGAVALLSRRRRA